MGNFDLEKCHSNHFGDESKNRVVRNHCVGVETGAVRHRRGE